MANDDCLSKSNIVEWMVDNQAFIAEIIEPYRKQRAEAISNSDPLFFDDIQKQYREKILSVIGIEVCKHLGCSVELYYEVAGDCIEWMNWY